MLKYFQKLSYFCFYLIPIFWVSGIFDYRFHNYFWSRFNITRFLPFYNSYFDFFSINSVFIFALLVVLVLFLVVWFASRCKKTSFSYILQVGSFKNILASKKNIYFLPFVFFLFAIFINALSFYPIDPYIKSWLAQINSNYLLPFTLVLFFFVFTRTKRIFSKFELILLFCMSFISFLALFQFYFNFFPGEAVDFLGRLVWPYIDPFVGMQAENANLLAYISAPSSLLSLLQIRSINRFRRYTGAFLFLLNFWVLILTQSYSSLLVVSILIFIYFFLSVKKFYKVLITVLFIAFSVVFLATQYTTPKFQVLLGKTERVSSLSRRSQIYKFNFAASKDVFVTGIGPGQYQSYFRFNQPLILDEVIPEKEIPPHPHNLIFNFVFDLGILALFGILLIYFLTARYIFSPGKYPYFYILAYFLLHGLVDTPYGLEEISSLFWLFYIMAVVDSFFLDYSIKELNKS